MGAYLQTREGVTHGCDRAGLAQTAPRVRPTKGFFGLIQIGCFARVLPDSTSGIIGGRYSPAN
jgi:hypothetical protein